jgi:hypothetical protein
VYVGKAKRMLARIEAHRSNWGRKSMPAWMPASLRGVLFDQVFIRPCKVEDLDRVEAEMIDRYRPKYNVQLKPPRAVPIQAEINLTIGPHTIPLNRSGSMGSNRFDRRI